MEKRNYKLEKRIAREKREKQIRMQLIISTLAITIIGILCFLFIGFDNESKASNAYKTCKQYTTIEVVEGDSIYSISTLYLEYGYVNRTEFYNEIILINNVTDELIKIGEQLILPQIKILI